MKRKPCTVPDCGREKRKGNPKYCVWHWLEKQPIDRQVSAAQWRLGRAQERPGFEHRARVPKAEWPAGGRWCAGCQSFVPEHYTRGSRCRACASQAAYASHLKTLYLRPDGQPFTDADYRTLYDAQGGKCYICQRKAVKRLAVDHSHATGIVRGLLCSSPDWGCNLKIVGILEGSTDPVGSARRLLGYLEGNTPAARVLQ